MDGHRGQVVLDDAVLIATNLLPRRRPIDMVGADQQGCAQPIPTALDDPVKQVGLSRGTMGRQVGRDVAVHLWRDHEGDVRIPEVPESALEEMRSRHVVRIKLGYDVVGIAVTAEPGIVVAGFRTRAVHTADSVELLPAAPAEMMHAESGG